MGVYNVKKLLTLFLAPILMLSLCSCLYVDYTYRDAVIASLPKYTSEVFYTSGGFQDYTDYAKYTYDSIPIENFETSEYFSAVTEKDVEEILLYLENFESWVETVGGELKDNYDFDKTVVRVGDFFYIETKYGQPIGDGTYDKFDNYDIYYFDIDAQILYYLHNNI